MKIRLNRLVFLAPVAGLSAKQILTRLGINYEDKSTALLSIDQARALLKIFTVQEVMMMLTGKSKYLAKQAVYGGA